MKAPWAVLRLATDLRQPHPSTEARARSAGTDPDEWSEMVLPCLAESYLRPCFPILVHVGLVLLTGVAMLGLSGVLGPKRHAAGKTLFRVKRPTKPRGRN